jgi:hypothetical protein
MTATTGSVGALTPAEFRVGRVLGRSARIFFQQFIKFFLLNTIVTLPSVLVVALGIIALASLARATAGVSLALLPLLLVIVLYIVCQLVAFYGAFQSLRGKPFGIGQSVKQGVVRFFPAIGALICMMAAIGAGFLLLIVPGFFLASMLYVVLPVCVVEKRGPFESLGRSAALTKDHRWRVFAISILVALVFSIGTILMRNFAVRFGDIALVLVALVWFSLTATFQAIVAAVVYHDLRMIKEGGDFEQIAVVFD